MKRFLLCVILFLPYFTNAQDYGALPLIPKADLLRDLDLLYQGLDQYHTGMYWYSSKDSVQQQFENARLAIDQDLNVLQFHKLIAPLIALSNEDHTDIFLPETVADFAQKNAVYFPLSVVYLGDRLYCVKDGSGLDTNHKGQEILSINGGTPTELAEKLGSLFSSDGYIQQVKKSDLEGFAFSRYWYFYFGNQAEFSVQFAAQDTPVILPGLKRSDIAKHLEKQAAPNQKSPKRELLEFTLLQDSIAYLGIHTFGNDRYKNNTIHKKLKPFLAESFKTIHDQNIQYLIIDVSENGGGSEGNDNLLYSYLGDNYQKYHKVKANRQKLTLDNGIDPPITLKTFGLLERVFGNKKMPDGSYERKKKVGFGLMAFKKKPRYPFTGDLYVIISPVTYSGVSEFSNMIRTQQLGIFVGQETGGGYYGNTSGYGAELTLPNSQITVDIPALQFIMKVEPISPFGRGVLPDHELIPTIEQYLNEESVAIDFILQLIDSDK
ncbi:MAG: S41 family peptidase [Bacteroidota bacterium]